MYVYSFCFGIIDGLCYCCVLIKATRTSTDKDRQSQIPCFLLFLTPAQAPASAPWGGAKNKCALACLTCASKSLNICFDSVQVFWMRLRVSFIYVLVMDQNNSSEIRLCPRVEFPCITTIHHNSSCWFCDF